MASGLLWLIANLLTNVTHNSTAELLFARLTLVGAALIPLTFLFFCYSFTDRLSNLSTRKYRLAILANYYFYSARRLLAGTLGAFPDP